MKKKLNLEQENYKKKIGRFLSKQCDQEMMVILDPQAQLLIFKKRLTI